MTSDFTTPAARAVEVRAIRLRLDEVLDSIVADELDSQPPPSGITSRVLGDFERALTTYQSTGSFTDRAHVTLTRGLVLEAWRSALTDRASTRSGAHLKARNEPSDDCASGARPIGVELDPALIAAITRDTEAGARLLRDVFERPSEPALPRAGPAAHVRDDAHANGDARVLGDAHRALLERLATQPFWPVPDLQRAARDLDLMGLGALEDLNTTAFAVCGQALTDGQDPIEVNQHALEQLRKI